MPRTKQTARKTTSGKAPKKVVSSSRVATACDENTTNIKEQLDFMLKRLKLTKDQAITLMNKKDIILTDYGHNNKQLRWMASQLPIDELNKLGIKVGLDIIADDEEYQILLLPSGKIIQASSDEEMNGPGCFHTISYNKN